MAELKTIFSIQLTEKIVIISKAQLKKHFSALNKEQIIEVML